MTDTPATTIRIPPFLKRGDGCADYICEQVQLLNERGIRVGWWPAEVDRREFIALSGEFSAAELRAMADMMESVANA